MKTDIYNFFPWVGTFSQLPIYLFQVGRVDSLTRSDPAAAQQFKLTYQFTTYVGMYIYIYLPTLQS